jgi:hypothetical protein
MLVQFTRDFQSAHTGEQFYRKGEKVDLPSGNARALIAEGAAVFVKVEVRRGQVKENHERI